MFTKAFLLAVLERALKAATNVVLTSYFVGDKALGIGEVDWTAAGSLFATGFVVSVLFSIGSGAVSAEPGPSLTNAEVLDES